MHQRLFRSGLPLAASLVWGLSLGAATPTPAAADVPKVVVSVKPVHSLVAGVMAGVGEPLLLIKGAASPHSYSLRPSAARALSKAQLVFWIGGNLEAFLGKPLASLASRARLVELAEAPGMLLLPTREGGAWGAPDDEPANDEAHQHGQHNPHIWLHPGNAAAIVRIAVTALAELDPANAATYRRNGAAVEQRLAALEREIAAALAPVKDQPYLVFHDAYQYFEAHFGTRAVGAITVSPDRAPGARRLYEIREKIFASKAVCVFSEPQFEPALVKTVVRSTSARTAVLDPLGAGERAGPEAYFQLMRGLAGALKDCLLPAS